MWRKDQYGGKGISFFKILNLCHPLFPKASQIKYEHMYVFGGLNEMNKARIYNLRKYFLPLWG